MQTSMVTWQKLQPPLQWFCYGESWDSSWLLVKKNPIWTSSRDESYLDFQSRSSESQFKKKKQGVLNWKCLGFNVTSQLMWRQTPHFFITATEIRRTGYSTKKSSNRSIVPYVLRDACHELFCVFGDFSASRTQDAEVTKSLHWRKKFTVLWSSIVIYKVLVWGPPHGKWIRGHEARPYIDQLTHILVRLRKDQLLNVMAGHELWVSFVM